MSQAGFTAHFIGIGDEILNGRVTDLNGPWLARFLGKRSSFLSRMKIVPDNKQAIIKQVKNIWNAPQKLPQLIIFSGGLGPTPDDMTKNAVAKAFGENLIPKPEAEKLVRAHYKKKNLDWSPQTNSYHIFPEHFTPLHNPEGLAPGLIKWSEEKSKVFVCLPGVPREFRSMLKEVLQHPKVQNILPSEQFIKESNTFCIRTRFKPEESIFGEIAPNLWEQLEAWGKVSSLPLSMGVDIYVNLKDEFQNSREELAQLINNSPLAPFIWQYGEKSLPELVIEKAREKNYRLGFAESCTGGLLANMLTNIPGSSDVFEGSLVTYSNSGKESILGVSSETLATYGAASQEVSSEMAEGARKALNADIALSFSGIAGPSGGSEKKPVGSVAIGLARKDKKPESMWLQFSGGREQLKERFATRGLHWLLDALSEKS